MQEQQEHTAAQLAREAWLKEASRDDNQRALPIREAWAMALSWQDALENRVNLVASAGEDRSRIVENSTWVEIRFSSWGDETTLMTLARAARSACITWQVLTRCRGYSAHENPLFWRQVFDALRGDDLTLPYIMDGPYHGDYERVRGWIDFFSPSAKVGFPRVRLYYGLVPVSQFWGSVCRYLFLGRDASGTVGGASDADALLEDVLQRLRPLVDPSRPPRTIDVSMAAQALPGESASTKDEFLASLHTAQPNEVPHSGDRLVPQFVVTELRDVGPQFFKLKPREFTAPLSVPSYIIHTEPLPPEARNLELTTVLQADGRRSIVTVDHITATRARDVPLLCSALPRTPTLQSAELGLTCDLPSEQEAAWLGFALFHPDTESSPWQALVIDQLSLSPSCVEAFRAMAMGNNLLPVLTGLPAKASTAYHSAQLAQGTSIRADPSAASEELWSVTQEQECHVDLCVPGDWDVTTTTDWVCVVARGYGHGWVPRSALGEVTSRPPSKCSLTSLRVVAHEASRLRDDRRMEVMPSISPDTLECLVAMMPLIGDVLRMLDVVDFVCVTEATLRSILVHCPSLRSLSVHLDGHFWATDTLQGDDLPCRLKELWIRQLVGSRGGVEMPCSAVVNTTLRNLSVLRICPSTSVSPYVDFQSLPLLLQRLGTIRHLHYDYLDLFANCGGLRHYAVADKTSWNQVGLKRSDKDAYADGDVLSVPGRIAFCSVIKTLATTGAAIGHVDQHVAKKIFSFTTSKVRREIWIGK